MSFRSWAGKFGLVVLVIIPLEVQNLTRSRGLSMGSVEACWFGICHPGATGSK